MSSLNNGAMLNVLLLLGIHRNFLKMRKKCGKLEGNIMPNIQIILWHPKAVVCYAPEYHIVLIHALLEQFNLVLTESFQPLASHNCQND